MDAILLAGGKAERLGGAAQGLPKPLVDVAGRPLAAYQVARLVAAGVSRVIVSCAAGTEQALIDALSNLGAEIVAAPEPEPLGRGGGIKLAARLRNDPGAVYALNGDELIDVDFGRLRAHHEALGAAATITVSPLRSAFGVVEVADDDRVTGFREAPRLPYWVNCGVYVLGDDAISRLPDRGDHERSTFPELAAEGRLRAFRHEGMWLTVNTPKDLRIAEEYVGDHPDWLKAR
jgi:NDP-sugar pyrophosphorylase family protein